LQRITILGLASGKTILLPYESSDLDKNLMFWLKEKGINIASSCDGQGVCKKCVIQEEILTCKFTLKEFFQREPEKKICISYF
jgi:Na+-transporting NADH:ubiquinone oxidoreductase subunit NqrF